jgi:hypothetical protein
MLMPKSLDLLTYLLIYFLLNIVLTLIQNCNVIRKHCNLNFWSFGPIERRFPSLNK